MAEESVQPAPEEPSSAAEEEFHGELIEVELAQSLGLTEALTIGVGTMIGAGIFVLPALIIQKAGPAAILSFFFGGVIALLAAMSAAEVATGMPKSGGGYYFISRALGPLWGAIIGWGSWFALIFASAFYAVGFGEYVGKYLGVSPTLLAIVVTVLLVGLNLLGSKAAGKAQNLIVAVLIAVLVLFLGRGGISAEPALLFPTEGFMPAGFGAVCAGTALLFVTYCGFGEIASMAEEIKDPGKNLPRALLGSVISVTILYCLVIALLVMLRPWQELQGATVVADVSGDLMGPWGRNAIIVGAVMATVSSANASIMSASRISFAMGRDNLIWEWLNVVHPKYRVPTRAIAVTGGLTVVIIAFADLEHLAEAAGLLHLLLYGLICVACVILRGAKTEVYRPSFHTPFFPFVPILGALGCFAVSFFMDPLTIAMGFGLIAFSILHYWFWGRKRTELRGAWPFFLRRSLLEPSLARVERWGAVPDELPTAMVAVANPSREEAKLRIVGAIMGKAHGEVLVVNVFKVGAEAGDDLTEYRKAIEDRERTLQEVAAPIVQAGGRVRSHVPVARSILFGLLSAAEASSARVSFLGWPEEGPGLEAQFKLLEALDQNLDSHVVLLREQGPLPAGSVLAITEPGPHGELALLAATRLANAWRAELTVAALVPGDATPEAEAEAAAALEAQVGDVVRANVTTMRGTLQEAAAALAPYTELTVCGMPQDHAGLTESVSALQNIGGCSFALVRANAERPLDFGIQSA